MNKRLSAHIHQLQFHRLANSLGMWLFWGVKIITMASKGYLWVLVSPFRLRWQQYSVHGSLRFNNSLQYHPRSHPPLLLHQVSVVKTSHSCHHEFAPPNVLLVNTVDFLWQVQARGVTTTLQYWSWAGGDLHPPRGVPEGLNRAFPQHRLWLWIRTPSTGE